MHTFPSNVYGSTVVQVPYYTTHAQCMLHPHTSHEGASNDVKVLRTLPRKSTHVYIITTYNRILHTNTPTQYRLNSIQCLHLSSMCGFTQVDKRQRSNLPGKGLEVPRDDSFTGKPSHVEKLSRSFQKLSH